MTRLLLALSCLLALVACSAPPKPIEGPAPSDDGDTPIAPVVIEVPTASPSATIAAPEGPEIVEVHDARGLLRSIGSNREIVLAPGTYDLNAAEHRDTRHVRWVKVYDGEELVIDGVENLTIRAATAERPTILARPRYAWVMRFVKSKRVTIDHLILGHTPAGACVGGVVAAHESHDVRVLDSDLFGSGTMGVELDKVQGFQFARSTIRECTYGIATIKRSTDVRFEKSRFTDNQEFDLVQIEATPRVMFDECAFEKNRTGRNSGYAFFKTDKASSFVLKKTSFARNTFDQLTNAPRRMRVVDPPDGGKFARAQAAKPDPQFNQIYALTRYQKWIVAGTQAGIVFWNPKTGSVDKIIKAFITSDLLVRGKHLWVGHYRGVMRFDGLKRRDFIRAGGKAAARLLVDRKGDLLVHQNKLTTLPNHWWRYDPKRDRFAPIAGVAPKQLPPTLGGGGIGLFYGALTRTKRARGDVWTIDFLHALHHAKGSTQKVIALKGTAYPGKDPRDLYEAPNGDLWAIDFDSGFFRYDDRKKVFVADPVVSRKASAMAIDAKRGRHWFLHYTNGLHVRGRRGPTKHLDMRRLQYMRALWLDPDGSVWVGGWNALVHVIPSQGKGPFRERSYEVSAATMPATP